MPDRPHALLVDDNADFRDAAQHVLGDHFNLLMVENAADALKELDADREFAVLISSQNLPDMKGYDFLGEAARRTPHTVRVMLTGSDDQSTAASAVNTGHVFRFLHKSCEPKVLLRALLMASAHYDTLVAEKRLMEQTLAGSVKVLTDVLACLRPDLFQRSSKVRKFARLIAKRMDMPHAWELDLAAMLYPLGLVSVPDEVAIKYANGETLTPDERHIIDQSAAMAERLVGNISRLDMVARGIGMCRKGFDGSGYPDDDVVGFEIPVISRILHIAIDVVDASAFGRASFDDIGEYLTDQKRLYDPNILLLVLDIVQDPTALSQSKSSNELILKPGQLEEGDIIFRDIIDKDGRLILAAGSELTDITAHRILNLARHAVIDGAISVSRQPAGI